MNNLKQAQVQYDNELPVDTSEQDDRIREVAGILTEYGLVDSSEKIIPDLCLADLEDWINNSNYKAISLKSKINKYKELQLALCECMIIDMLNEKEVNNE